MGVELGVMSFSLAISSEERVAALA